MVYIQCSDFLRPTTEALSPMEALQTVLLQCPNCWEQVEIVVDYEDAEQEIIEDCSVCCGPMIIAITAGDDDELHAAARLENG
jgi:hypothetical protein